MQTTHSTPPKKTKQSFYTKALICALPVLLVCGQAQAWNVNSVLNKTKAVFSNNSSSTVAATGSIEVAFSPNEGSEALVVKVINSAKGNIHLLGYSFTSAPVVQALLSAKHRGVQVKVVVDYKSNVSEDRSGKARAAMSALVNSGIEVRTVSVYPIHHDKVIIVDGQTVELGSYNYSDAAAHKNSENVFVNWNNPQLASVYQGHFERNYNQSEPYSTRY